MSTLREKLAIPGRGEFKKRNNRYVDSAGRMYILPTQEDAKFVEYSRIGIIGEANYERELRRGLSFDSDRDVQKLGKRVMLYFQLPPVTTDSASTLGMSTEPIGMPVPYANARNESERTLILRDVNTGDVYTARIDSTQAQRRDRRGFVLLSDVNRIARAEQLESRKRQRQDNAL